MIKELTMNQVKGNEQVSIFVLLDKINELVKKSNEMEELFKHPFFNPINRDVCK